MEVHLSIDYFVCLYERLLLYRRVHHLTPVSCVCSSAVSVRFGHQDKFPDGATVDAEDCVWVALYGAGVVRRYSPAGELLLTIAVRVVLVYSFYP